MSDITKKVFIQIILFVFTVYLFNVISVSASNALVMTVIRDDEAFDVSSVRENGSSIYLLEGDYVSNENGSQKSAKLKISYTYGIGDIKYLRDKWHSGFSVNPAFSVKSRDAFIRMNVLFEDCEELCFFLQDLKGNISYISAEKYLNYEDYGTWKQLEIPVIDFYDTNLKLKRDKISSFGVAWIKSAETLKTVSTPDDCVYITDMQICDVESVDVCLKSISGAKACVSWNKLQDAEEYKVYRNGECILTTVDTEYTDEILNTEYPVNYQVSAVVDGLEGIKSEKLILDIDNIFFESTLFQIYDEEKINSYDTASGKYLSYWPTVSSQSGGKYITCLSSTDAYSQSKSLKFSFPAKLNWGNYYITYNSPVDFAQYEKNGMITMWVKTSDASREMSVRLEDSNGVEINLGNIITTGTGNWEKMMFPFSAVSTSDFDWNSVKIFRIVYAGSSRTEKLEVLIDYIKIENTKSIFQIGSSDTSPNALNPNSTYYALCEAKDDTSALYAAYYDENGNLLNLSTGHRTQNDIFVAAIRTGTEISENHKIKLFYFDDALKPISKPYTILCVATEDATVNTSKWYRYEQPDYDLISGSALDMSYVLDSPAGKHGFVTVQNNNFVFEDGTKAKFWGTNVVGEANFLTNEDIDTLVNSIAASGFNVVRVHHMDSYYYTPNIFGYDKNSITIDSKQMDKFNYFWYKLKEKGIYIIPSLLCSRRVTDEMGVKDADTIGAGMKIEGMFDETLIKMQKDYAKALLTYVNPYTGTTLANDPSSVMFEIHNECNILMYGENTDYIIESDYYYNKFCEMFTNWLIDRYGTRQKISEAWNESVAMSGNINFPANYLKIGYSDKHIADCRRFLHYVANKYHSEMINYLKNTLDIKVPLAGTNNSYGDNLGDVYENAMYDYMDRHQYWSHPVGGYDFASGLSTYYPGSVIKATGAANPYRNIAVNNVYGKPLLVSEWNAGKPNRFIGEIQTITSAIFAYQGWNGCQFDFLNGQLPSTNKIVGTLDMMGDPLGFGTASSASAAFHKISEAQSGYYITCSESMAHDINQQKIDGYNMAFMIGKIGLNIPSITGQVAENDDTFINRLYDAQNTGVYISSTNEIIWDTNDGVLLVNSPYANFATGFIKGRSIELSDMKVNVGNDFANITLVPCENSKIEDASRLLLTACGKAKNTDFETNYGGTTVVNSGDAPILLEQIEGAVAIKGDDFKVYILSSSGERTKVADTYIKDGYTVLNLTIADKTMHYEFVRDDKDVF